MSQAIKAKLFGFRSYINRILNEGTEGLEIEAAAFMRRINAYLLSAGLSLIILSLALSLLIFIERVQLVNAICAGIPGIGILVVRRWLINNPHSGMQRAAVNILMAFLVSVVVIFSLSLPGELNTIPYITPLLCPATIFLFAMPLQAAYLLGARGTFAWMFVSIAALTLLLIKTLGGDISIDDKLVNAGFYVSMTILILQVTVVSFFSWLASNKQVVALTHQKAIIDEQAKELRAARDQALELAAELKLEIKSRKRAHEEVYLLNKELEERVIERTAELDKACEELKELDKMKDSFLTLVSHELRTPLTSIRSFSEILLKYKDEDLETREEFTSIILSESERLSRLINNVLDLSRIEAGEMLWKDEFLVLKEIIQEVKNAQQPLLKQKSIRLNLNLPKEIPLVRADRDRIQQVITNLVGNAYKFSLDGGEINIRAETVITKKSDDATHWVKISISDKGTGIDKADHKTIFDKFHQITDNALRVKPHGTGLGLPICKEIITHYKGKIWVESGLEGKGSTFSFTLPADANEH